MKIASISRSGAGRSRQDKRRVNVASRADEKKGFVLPSLRLRKRDFGAADKKRRPYVSLDWWKCSSQMMSSSLDTGSMGVPNMRF